MMGVLLVAFSTTAIAAKNTTKFDPRLYSEENLPAGISFITAGTIDAFNDDGLVVGDIQFSLKKIKSIVTTEGEKRTTKSFVNGRKVEVYSNADYEAVYVVVK